MAGRLIPARAGNTGTTTTEREHDAAHPRSRGEHCLRIGVQTQALGSSPLARGTLQLGIVFTHPCRLIPARAGNTIYSI